MNKIAPFVIFFDRNPESVSGFLTLQDLQSKPINHKGFTFKRITALSGQPGHTRENWTRGKAPIPYSQVAGDYWLSFKSVGVGLNPGATGIGEAFPIASNPDRWADIVGQNGELRTLIRLHKDNLIRGSAGCIVLPYEGKSQAERNLADALFDFFHTQGRLYTMVKLRVV